MNVLTKLVLSLCAKHKQTISNTIHFCNSAVKCQQSPVLFSAINCLILLIWKDNSQVTEYTMHSFLALLMQSICGYIKITRTAATTSVFML